MVNQIIFASILQTWYVELRVSRSISESPLGLEITRVDCNCLVCVGIPYWLISGRKQKKHIKQLPNNIITKTCLFKYAENFTTKNWKFSDKNSDNFHISAQNIDCGYSLEPPRRGGSNEYPQSMFKQNKKNNVYHCKPQFYYIKMSLRESKVYRRVFVMSSKQYPRKYAKCADSDHVYVMIMTKHRWALDCKLKVRAKGNY